MLARLALDAMKARKKPASFDADEFLASAGT
jgi:hypothetical protein